ALSENEMSFAGRNWAKLGKRLLQGDHTGPPTVAKGRVVPLANQLVSTTDSVIGIYSNQGGSACGGLAGAERSSATPTAAGKPGLCITYPGLIKRAFYAGLWRNTTMHLDGCYTDGNVTDHPNRAHADDAPGRLLHRWQRHRPPEPVCCRQRRHPRAQLCRHGGRRQCRRP